VEEGRGPTRKNTKIHLPPSKEKKDQHPKGTGRGEKRFGEPEVQNPIKSS